MTRRRAYRGSVLAVCVGVLGTACGYQGVNALPLPGAVGRGADAEVYHIEIANIGTLEPNSPVLIDDVVVGSVGRMTVDDQWNADVTVTLRPGTEVAANAVAAVGQTSLLGSMHIALDPPLGERAQGRLPAGSTIALARTRTFPSTERTLSALSTVVNAGGLGQIGDIVHNANAALSGHRSEMRDLLGRLEKFVSLFDDQRDDVLASIRSLDRLSGTLVAQNDVIRRALREIPPALDVLIAHRQQLVTALDALRAFSDTAVSVVGDTQTDLVKNLTNLEPTVKALADVGPDIDKSLAFLPVMPFGQNLIDRGVRGDYMNLFAVFDLTVPRLKRTLLSGTRFGDDYAQLTPAPGDPGYDAYYNPLTAPVAPPPPAPPATPPPGGG